MNAPRRFAKYDPEICLNCGADLDVDDRFCRDCGQRNRRHARSILAWIAEGLSSLFHLEGKLFNTLRDLPKPGRYAYNYLNGQRERYVHPLRLLLFSSLASLAAMSAIGWLGDDLDFGYRTDPADPASFSVGPHGSFANRSRGDSAAYSSAEAVAERRRTEAEAATLRLRIDSLRAAREALAARPADTSAGGALGERIAALVAAEIAGAPAGAIEEREALVEEAAEGMGGDLADRIETLEGELDALVDRPQHPAYRRMRAIDQLRADLVAHDRAVLLAVDLAAGGYAETDAGRLLLDTLLATYPMPRGWGEDPPGGGSAADNFSIFDQELKASARVLAVGTPAQVTDSMHVEGTVERLVATKAVAMYQGGVESVVGYLVANISWAVLLFVPLIAFGYYLFYNSRMPFYAQNLAYAAILLSVVLLAVTIGVGLTAAGAHGAMWVVLILGMGVYAIAGEAHLYGVPWWKAALKNFAIACYGAFAFMLAVGVWLVLAVALA